MFTGIVERTGRVRSITHVGAARRLLIDLGRVADGLAAGASVAVNGVCLTVASIDGQAVGFDVIPETLDRSNLGRLRPGDPVNLERSLCAGDPIDGHFVQGHIDGVGTVTAVDRDGEDCRVAIAPPLELMRYMVPKGSVALDGVSLTIAAVSDDAFTVALIPTTLDRTTMGRYAAGDAVNIETDVIVRTVARLLDAGPGRRAGLDLATLKGAGFA